MSLGGIIGGVLGGIVGFFIGGPTGVLYGASIGFSLGLAIDPITPDITGAGTPLPDELDLMPSNIGVPLPDLVGTGKILGHLLCFGKERVVAITVEVEGGCFSSDEDYITGYKYYMSWAVGIVSGPVNILYAVYRNDDVVWEGELELPISGGQETISLNGMGSAVFYFGTDDQIANSKVGEILGDATFNSPFRHLCWCFLDDCYIGEFNRCPTMKFIVGKSPVMSFSVNNVIQVYDYNPMHALWYIFHDLAGLPEEWLHSTDFAIAAATLSSETRGICCLFANQQSVLDFLESITNHIDGLIRYGSDGKFHPKLIREDYIVDDLLLIDEDVMLDNPTLTRKSWIDTINEMRVQYSEIIQVPSEGFVYYHDLSIPAIIEFKNGVETRRLTLGVADNQGGTSAALDTINGKGYWKVQNTVILEVDLENMVELRRYDAVSAYNLKGLAIDMASRILYYTNRTLSISELNGIHIDDWTSIGSPIVLDGALGVISPLIFEPLYRNLYTFQYSAWSRVYQRDVDGVEALMYADVWPSSIHSIFSAAEEGVLFVGGDAANGATIKKLEIPVLGAIIQHEAPDVGIPSSVYSGAYDAVNGFAYFVTYSVPCFLIKWPIGAGDVQTLQLSDDGSYSALYSTVISVRDKKLYIGMHCIAEDDFRLIIVDLNTFVISSVLTKTSGDGSLTCGLCYEHFR